MLENNQNRNSVSESANPKEILISLWEGRTYIVSLILIFSISTILYLHQTPRKFEVIYSLAPVQDKNPNLKLGGLQGFASLAGISIPSSSSGDFLTFKFLLNSEEVSRSIVKDEELIKSIFRNEWDTKSEKFYDPSSWFYRNIFRPATALITGGESEVYVQPNSRRLSDWMTNSIKITEDRDTGFMQLSSETSDPKTMIKLLIKATLATDNLLKERYILTSEQTMQFYKQQLTKARAIEHREALATLIAQEDQKLILATRENYFVAEPITSPSVSLYPTSPNARLIFALAILLGGLLGATIVFVRKALK